MEPNMEKRMLIAIVLTLGLLMLWRAFFAPPPPPPPSHTKSNIVSKSAPAEHSTQGHAPAPPAPVALAVQEGTAAQDIVVENSFYRVTLSSQGGVVKSWVLRKYQDAQNKPLDVVNASACAQFGYPMSLRLADASLAAKLNSALYVASPAASSGATLAAPAVVTFTYSDGKIQVKKEFTFGAGYGVRVSVSVFDGQHNLPVSVEWAGGIGDQSLAASMRDKESKAFYDHGDSIKTVSQKKAKDGQLIPGPLMFAGLEDNFFAGAFFPASPQDVFGFSQESWTPPGWKGKESPEALLAVVGSPQPEPLSLRIYIAPKELDVLRAGNPTLEGLVNFGWFSIIAKPLFLLMRWTHQHVVHNWGWVIVLLTVVINLLFFPLKMKSIRSAQAMQKVAPLVKQINDKYKQYKFNDPRKQKAQQEIMKIYNEHGVNPLGGCLPMVGQLPIIYAFYEVLETSIAMRHSPWIFWIKDLAVPDPLYILPILAIVLSFLMQKMTPMPSVDPAQQRMMMIAPLAVGFIFFYEAAGLTLYYFIYCLMGILQQLAINRIAPPPAKTSTPPVKAQAPRAPRPAPVKG